MDSVKTKRAGARPGKPKGDKRARTRAALLGAAKDIVLKKGFEQTTLEDVAAAAGMTIGAIYGNFRNKEELFLAVVEDRWAPIAPALPKNCSFEQAMALFADEVIASIPQRRRAALGSLSFRTYALGHENVRRRLRDATADGYKAKANWLRDSLGEEALPMPAEQLAVVLHVVTEGILIQRFVTPELVTDDIIRAAFAAIGKS